MLKMYRNIPNELSNLLELKTGHLKIGINNIIKIRKLIKLISQFHEYYTNVTFKLFENGSKKIANEIYYHKLYIDMTVLLTNNKIINIFYYLDEKLKLLFHKNH